MSFWKKKKNQLVVLLVRKHMGVNEHERLFNSTLRHKLKYRSNAFIPVLHLTVTVYFFLVGINSDCLNTK